MGAQQAAQVASETVKQRSGKPDAPPVPPITSIAQARTDIQVIPTTTGTQLAVARPLALSERMIALAAAISIDYDFFSKHSRSSGLFSPPLIIPGGGGAEATGTGEAAPGVEGQAAGGGVGAAGSGAGGGLERDLGGDGFTPGAPQPPPAEPGGDWGGGWGQPPQGGDGEMKWDLPSGEGGEEGGGGVGGVLGTLWRVFGGGDD